VKSFFRQQKAHAKPTGGVSKRASAHHQKAAPAILSHSVLPGIIPDPILLAWILRSSLAFASALTHPSIRFVSRDRRSQRRRRRGRAGGAGVRHGHAVRALPRPPPHPALVPRRRTRPRPAAGPPRALRRRPALPLGRPRLNSAVRSRVISHLHAICSASIYRTSW
jgi:hypothetical protein